MPNCTQLRKGGRIKLLRGPTVLVNWQLAMYGVTWTGIYSGNAYFQVYDAELEANLTDVSGDSALNRTE